MYLGNSLKNTSMNLFYYIFSLSLFDSISTTQQIIIFMLLLTTNKPIKNSIAYLVGLSGSYILCGIVGFFAIDKLHCLLKYFPSTDCMSNASYYQLELISGIIMLVGGIWYYKKKRHAPADRTQNLIIIRLKSMNMLVAALIGVFISVSSFPVAIPYILALNKLVALKSQAAIGYVLLYNLGYALPMLIIFGIYLYARRGTDDLHDKLHEKARILNVKLTSAALIGVGLLSMIDAGYFFTLGQALIKGRML
jgi:cytochrome c biogenesis protein CcdA